MDGVLAVTSLRWYDTLAWLEGDNSAVLSTLTEKLLKPLPSSEVLETATAGAWLERSAAPRPTRKTRRRSKQGAGRRPFRSLRCGVPRAGRWAWRSTPSGRRRRRGARAGKGDGRGRSRRSLSRERRAQNVI